MENYQLKTLTSGLKKYYNGAAQAETTIVQCARNASIVNAVLPSFLPLSARTIITDCDSKVVSMCKKLCNNLSIYISDAKLNSIAKTTLSHISTNFSSLIVVWGNQALTRTTAKTIFSFIGVYLAGVTFLNLVLEVAKNTSDPYSFHDVNENYMKRVINAMKFSEDDIRTAQKAFFNK